MAPERHETLETDTEQKQERIVGQKVISKAQLGATKSARLQGSHVVTLATQGLEQTDKDAAEWATASKEPTQTDLASQHAQITGVNNTYIAPHIVITCKDV